MCDAGFSFQSHISQIRQQCSYHSSDLTWIRRFLSKSVAITLANALVSSRLDYCNSLLYGITVLLLFKVFKILSVVSSQELLGILVLEIILTFCFGFLQRIALSLNFVLSPTKPWSMVCHHISVHSLYHIVHLLVQDGDIRPITYYFDYRVHKSKKHFDCCFSVAGPKLLNSLPLAARSANSPKALFTNYLNHTCLTSLFPRINSSL